MSSTAVTSARTILKGPDDWIPWLEMVKSTATTGQVWEYVDPSKTADQIPALTEPVWPESSSLPLTAEERDSGILTAAHKEQLSELRSLYKLMLSRNYKRKASLASIHRFIQETVHPDRVHHTFNCDSVHQMLVNLQQRLKPRDDVRRLQLTDQYRELQKSPKNKNLDTWIISWEKVYREGIALTQPIVQKDTAVQDFLRAVFDIAPASTTPPKGLISTPSLIGFESSARSWVLSLNLVHGQHSAQLSRDSRKQSQIHLVSVASVTGTTNAGISTIQRHQLIGRRIQLLGRRLKNSLKSLERKKQWIVRCRRASKRLRKQPTPKKRRIYSTKALLYRHSQLPATTSSLFVRASFWTQELTSMSVTTSAGQQGQSGWPHLESASRQAVDGSQSLGMARLPSKPEPQPLAISKP